MNRTPEIARVKYFAVRHVTLIVLLLASHARAQEFDITQQQSPAKPAPSWLRIKDQGDNDPRLKGYFTPEGFKVEIVAEHPIVTNPVGMTFGDDGNLYVLEWRREPAGKSFPEHPVTFTYKDGTTRKVVTMKKSVKDTVKVLRDTKGRGIYDEAKVVLEDELPSSILLHDGWLYLSGRGTVRRYKQSKPGGAYDVMQIIAQGFCGYHHHQVSGMSVGNDGWLYLTSGDDDNYVEGSDGSRATVLRTGAIFRCWPDGSRMHVYAIGFRNPYRDVAFDAAFNLFHADNDNEDGSKFTGCRIMHVAEGSDFGWRLRTGARCCVPDHVRGAVFGELPGKVPPLLKTGRGAPAGLLIYNDTRLPDHFRGLLFYPDVVRRLIRAYKVEPRGASFEVTEEFEFLKSDDPLFRPCQMVLGPDGAIYVCDWRTDSGGAGRLWGDGEHGRIYRVSWAGTKDRPAIPLRGMDSWGRFAELSADELLKALASEDLSHRQRAQNELVRRGVMSRPALLKLLADSDEPLAARIAALGALQSFWNEKVRDAFLGALTHAEPDLRRLAADGLALNCQSGDKVAGAALLQKLNDPDPAVRRAVALATGQIGAEGAAEVLVNTLAFSNDKDVVLRDGLLRAIEQTGKEGMDRLLDLAQSGDQKNTDKVVEAFLALRTRPAVDALPTLLKNPHLAALQRAKLVRSYTNYLLDPPVSLEPALEYLAADLNQPAVVKLAGLEVLSTAGALGGERAQRWLLSLLAEDDSDLRLSAIRAVEQLRLVKAAPPLLRLLGDSSRTNAERAAAVAALRLLNDKSAVPLLKGIVSDPRAAGVAAAPLQLEALRSLAALDPKAGADAAIPYLNHNDIAMNKEAVDILGAQAAGAKLVGQRFLDKKLPRELLAQISEALRKHADKDPEAAGLLKAVLTSGLLVSSDPAELARIRKLVAEKGRPENGKAIFLNNTTLACLTCHRLEGVGGDVGPDLTQIWSSHSIEKIIESIVEPGKEIKEGYQAYVATTKKGLVYTGLKVAQTADEVVLRDASAKEVRIAMKDLDELSASKHSLMPDNVVANLSFDQFIDLVAFLASRSSQESLRGKALDFWVVGPFEDNFRAGYPPEAKPDPAATYASPLTKQQVAWQPRQALPNGYLNLRSVFDREYVSVYALTYVYAPKQQDVHMLVGSDDGVRVWVNGSLVHENAVHRAAGPDQDSVRVTLREGWNPVLVKVVNEDGGHGLYLRFAGGQGLRVARKPEGK